MACSRLPTAYARTSLRLPAAAEARRYVDVLLIHWPDVNTPFEETMHALDSAVRQGKVRAVGLSNFTLDQLKECRSFRRVDVVQYGFNMFDRREVKDNLAVLGWALSAAEMEEIDGVFARHGVDTSPNIPIDPDE